MGFVLVFSYSI